jgi:hypothetical protein
MIFEPGIVTSSDFSLLWRTDPLRPLFFSFCIPIFSTICLFFKNLLQKKRVLRI